MTGIGWLVAVLMLLAGVLAGAAVAAWLMRGRLLAAQGEAAAARRETGEVNANFAAADAERRLLFNQNRALSAQQGSDSSVLQALGPVSEKLNAVQRQVALLERDRVEQYGQLAEQLREAKDADARLLATTTSLESALRSNNARGKWGEVQLRRVVEAAGMLAHVDFEEQVHTATADGAHRPDMVVHLPGGKELVLDAKVPLSSYLHAHDAGPSAGAGADAHLARHAKAVKAHVDALAAKKYWTSAHNSPELVICFVPVESILSSALVADPSLLDYAMGKSVVLASPISLLAILKSIAFSWRQDVLTESAKELFDLSAQLYSRLGVMGEAVSGVGASLKTSVERYNKLVGTLESRVLPTARKLNAFDPNTLSAPALVEAVPRSLTAPELEEQAG
ncbi:MULTISPECIES: DNA recombination protein RmuC [unclassified Arthrobacter]|uniref:DNA recombination protein RmuC n=1 Tax=unclassified Arthrobacter TaxID=235627 RepID=UPI00159E5AAB|nr:MULTISPECIES: DNA recombination protein RmuC [unclassified Arthrobacter]MCQ9165846.1 DNA recombination protein RmuC [Arthrobacter sp. STN4]NVM99717.1 DNA recombination protein RmuC [Arthrobacter sp. SDTb3-6]